MTTHGLFGTLTTAIALIVSTQCFADNIPERFRGVWQAIEGEERTCKASDWNSDRRMDTHVKVEDQRVRYHESECRFRTVTRPKPAFDSCAVHVVVACEGEGERWSSSQIWKILSVEGMKTLSMTVISKQSPSVSLYRKCDGEEAEQTNNAPKNGNIVSSSATVNTSNLRSELTKGRHCFAQKQEGAEFTLNVEPSGKASFTIDVANPRTKHLCYAEGVTTKTAAGWRYVDTSQRGETCELDIDVSDRIRFRFGNNDCERRYCGGRASITSLVFSTHDKMVSCR